MSDSENSGMFDEDKPEPKGGGSGGVKNQAAENPDKTREIEKEKEENSGR